MPVTVIDHTIEELASTLRYAKQHKLEISVQRLEHCSYISIAGIPLEWGLGEVLMSIPKSHRKADKLRSIPGIRWSHSNLHYTRFYYYAPNNKETIEKVKALGGTVTRDQKITVHFKTCTRQDLEWYENNVRHP